MGGGFPTSGRAKRSTPVYMGLRGFDTLRQLDSHSECWQLRQVVVRSQFPFHLRIIVMSKKRSALKIIAEIILMIVIFGIAMLFTHRGNINDKKTIQQKQNSNPSPDG